MPEAGPLRRSPLRILDFVFILRPTVLVGMWVFFLAGAVLASRHAGVNFPLLLLPWRTLLGFLSMSLALGGGLLLNQITDVETDRVNDKLFFLPRGVISVHAAWVELALVWLLAAALAVPLSPGFRIVLAAAILINLTYSAPPARTKSKAPWDLIWNGVGFGLASTAAGWAAVAPLHPSVLPVAATYAVAVAGVTASTTILDIEGDSSEGLRTTAVVLGRRGTSWLALVLVAVACAAGGVLRDPLGFFGPLLSLPLLLRAHATDRRSDRIAAHQIMVAAFALVAALRAPVLVVLVAAVYFGSRAYYAARFGVSYPGLDTR